MPKVYSTKVLDVLTALKDLITARATADGITVGEVVIGEKFKDQTFANGGVYIVLPADRDARIVAGTKREPTLHIPVLVVHRGYDDNPSTLAVLDLVGLVMDTVLANPTLNGKCMVATPEGSEPDAADLDDITVYAATVTVAARMSHGTT